MKSLYDPDYWKERAAKTRRRAEDLGDGELYVSLLRQAEGYDRLAKEAAQHGPTLPLDSIDQLDAVVPEPAAKTAKRFLWPFARLWRSS